ncbi:DUF6686 family protein [uncultured Croceitalea sp.]|uniref:DUF6686 family protein n=1 Tax=uncultured Croceitalea sp. TaxID=1798908 RepID=UPI00374F2965
MCPSLKTISNSKNGILTYCNNSKLFQLVFNNLCFEFYEWELETFKKHITELDVVYWENQLICSQHQRKIPISIGHKCFIILVNREEVLEIKWLLKMDSKTTNILKSKDIEYPIFSN